MINIVLYQPEIAGNCGNIVRTCASINARLHLIHPLGFSLDEKSFKRAGMDYFLDCEIIEYNSIEEFYQNHPNQEIFYITRYAKKVYSDEDYSLPTKEYYFMFGKESTGIPYDILKNHLEHCLRIPMQRNARSLNLSNCVAIISYEACRQQDFFLLATEETFKGADFLLKE
jgi:putative tRNA (cytidine/uridine-2'-O-)-methyltransferase LMOf2365_0956